jgi:type IV pilus assembly protein PilC
MLETYEYRARDAKGRVKSGAIDAESREAVLAHLREQGYLPVSITEKRIPLFKREVRLSLGRKVKLAEVSVFARQLATMIESGITIVRALTILQSQTGNPVLKEAITTVRQRITSGQSFSEAIGSSPKIFDRLFVAMVRAGETSGNLDVVLGRAATSLESRVELQRKIKSAVTYPAAVLVLVVLILTAMLVYVVPTFKSIFATLGSQLPLPTRILLFFSHLAVEFFPLLILFYIGVVVGFVRFKRTKRGKAFLDRVGLKLPVFGVLIQKYAISRFCSTLSTLVSSGVTLMPALEIAGEVSNHTLVQEAAAATRTDITQGGTMADGLAKHRIFPPMVPQMIAVGEESGSVDTMLEKVAKFYQSEVSAMTESLSSLLEPLLIVVLGAVVGSMVIALYLPMLDIIKLLK